MAEPVTQTNENAEDAKPKSLGAKAILAVAFSTVGAKISTLFSVMDVSNLLKGENKTFGEKLKGLTDGHFADRIRADISKNLAEYGKHSSWNMMKAVAKTTKWTIASTVVFMGGGAVLGWMRGDRVESVKDIFVHPLQSTKLVLGIGEEAKEKLAEKQSNTQVAMQDAASTKWQDKTGQRSPSEMTR